MLLSFRVTFITASHWYQTLRQLPVHEIPGGVTLCKCCHGDSVVSVWYFVAALYLSLCQSGHQFQLYHGRVQQDRFFSHSPKHVYITFSHNFITNVHISLIRIYIM